MGNILAPLAFSERQNGEANSTSNAGCLFCYNLLLATKLKKPSFNFHFRHFMCAHYPYTAGEGCVLITRCCLASRRTLTFIMSCTVSCGGPCSCASCLAAMHPRGQLEMPGSHQHLLDQWCPESHKSDAGCRGIKQMHAHTPTDSAMPPTAHPRIRRGGWLLK